MIPELAVSYNIVAAAAVKAMQFCDKQQWQQLPIAMVVGIFLIMVEIYGGEG